MDRDQLTGRHAAVIRRHWRTLTDNGGVPPEQMLADLAAIADEHALSAAVRRDVYAAYQIPEELRESLERLRQEPPGGQKVTGGPPPPPVPPQASATARRPAKRRTGG